MGPVDIIDNINSTITFRSESTPAICQIGTAAAFCMQQGIPSKRDDYLRVNAEEYARRRDFVAALVNGHNEEDYEARLACIDIIESCGNQIDKDAAYRLLYKGIPGVSTVHTPEAGYFHLLDFSKLKGASFEGRALRSGLDFVNHIAKHSGVVLLPGELMLFERGEPFGRMSYALSVPEIIEGLVRMSKAVEMLEGVGSALSGMNLFD